MIAELYKSGIKAKQISDDYSINDSMIKRWSLEYDSKSGDFSKKKELSIAEQKLKDLRKQLKDVIEERDILKKAVAIFSKIDR
jgi:transposase